MGLEFAAGFFRLPCAPECPFNKACAKKYQEGVCVSNVANFIREEIYGTPQKIFVGHGEIKFKTENPAGEISISDGCASISR